MIRKREIMLILIIMAFPVLCLYSGEGAEGGMTQVKKIVSEWFDLNDISIREINEPFTYYEIKNNGSVFHMLLSEKMDTSEKGYNGLIHLAILLNSDNAISEVIIADHNDTDGFIEYIIDSGFIDDLKEAGGTAGADVISGATLSCQAIKNGLLRTMKKYNDEALNK